MSEDDQNSSGSADLQQMAKQYVDLWEQQIKALAGDDALAQTMAQTMELMNAGAANVAAMMQKAATQGNGTENRTGADDGSDNSADKNAGNAATERKAGAHAKAAGAAPGRTEPDVRELTLRIAELERRLARLEGLTEPSGKIAAKKSGKS